MVPTVRPGRIDWRISCGADPLIAAETGRFVIGVDRLVDDVPARPSLCSVVLEDAIRQGRVLDLL